MPILRDLVTAAVKGITAMTCRIDYDALAQVPRTGPLIIVGNHINFLEVPLVYSHLQPRPITGFAKVEIWRNPVLRFLFNLWEAIPIERGEVDRKALRAGLEALQAGKIFALAPEGTRSGHGRLQRGRAGVVMLALRSGAPLLPVVYYGGERIFANLVRLRRTNFRLVVGNPFTLDPGEVRVTSEVRQQMVDEIMYQLAALLPGAYRGVYANLGSASEKFLRFHPPSVSNLQRAIASQTY